MRTPSPPPLYDRWTHPSYELRVRATTYLWGSAKISTDLKFDKPLLLHVRNDQFGEDITLGTQAASGAQTTLGTLAPGQCVSIPMQDISGVFATCTLESTVACLIQEST
jgi:hypothetical protein